METDLANETQVSVEETKNGQHSFNFIVSIQPLLLQWLNGTNWRISAINCLSNCTQLLIFK